MQQNRRGIIRIVSYKGIYLTGLKPLHNVSENVYCEIMG